MSDRKDRMWVVALHRFSAATSAEDTSPRHEEIARFEGTMAAKEVARFMERWYAEHQESGWTAEIQDNLDIDIGHEPKLMARLLEVGKDLYN